MQLFSFLVNQIEQGHASWAWIALVLAFALLAYCADLFVDSSVGIADKLRIPKLVIGIVLVSMATTSPELSVSLMAALKGSPEMALGNAVGSVICNCGVALALCGIFSRSAVPVVRQVFLPAGIFLAAVMILLLVLVLPDGTLGRLEGSLLLICFAGYLVFLMWQYRTGSMRSMVEAEVVPPGRGWFVLTILFLAGLGGVILASRFVVVSSISIALRFGIPESVVALTLVAFGTSVPEVATSVTAAIKGQGALAIGNILGANIMNICWVAGASAMVNSLTLQPREIYFMFPAMFVMVAVTLWVLHSHSSLSRKEGALLFGCYVIYLFSFILVFRPS